MHLRVCTTRHRIKTEELTQAGLLTGERVRSTLNSVQRFHGLTRFLSTPACSCCYRRYSGSMLAVLYIATSAPLHNYLVYRVRSTQTLPYIDKHVAGWCNTCYGSAGLQAFASDANRGSDACFNKGTVPLLDSSLYSAVRVARFNKGTVPLLDSSLYSAV